MLYLCHICHISQCICHTSLFSSIYLPYISMYTSAKYPITSPYICHISLYILHISPYTYHVPLYINHIYHLPYISKAPKWLADKGRIKKSCVTPSRRRSHRHWWHLQSRTDTHGRTGTVSLGEELSVWVHFNLVQVPMVTDRENFEVIEKLTQSGALRTQRTSKRRRD